jgi:hypothetical protein
VDGFLNKKDEFNTRVEDYKPKIIALTEIKPKNALNFIESEYNIAGYDMFLNKNHKRGVALYVDSKLNAHECDDNDLNSTAFQECVWCTLETVKDGKVLLGCVYRSPNTSTEENDGLLFQLLKSDAVSRYEKVCILGDFNFPNVRWDGIWSGEKCDKILQHVQDAFLIQMVENPTRRRLGQNPTLDDWILVNDDGLISNIEHLDPVGKSDHDVLKFELYVDNGLQMSQGKTIFSLAKGDYCKMRDIVRSHDWSATEEMGVEEAWCHMKSVLQNAMEECIPKVKTGNGKKTKPVWMNKKALRVVKKKHKLFQRYLRTKAGRDYEKYIVQRNKCSKLIKQTRKDYEKHIAKESKTNPKKFWKYIQERMRVNTGISALRTKEGSLATDDVSKANTLNDFFSSVFTQEDLTNVPKMEEGSYSDGVFLSEIRVTPLAVQGKLKDLNPNKSQGPDGIPPRVLKEVSEELSVPLCALFNKSLESGILPEDWKTASVTALFKKGSKQDPGNYRPVSLTCILCKVLESVVRDALVAHFTDNKLYTDCQHGFRKKRSCVTQLLQVMEDFTSLVDQSHDIDVVYCDFRKAFDSVPHERLLVKLAVYGICGDTLKWIRSFLSGRTQQVKVGEAVSGKAKVISGIPQGSILGPILFTIFINDLPDSLISTCKIFADDTKIYDKASNNVNIQRDIYKLQEWCDLWNLYFNVSKCGVMHIGRKNPGFDYVMKIKDDVQKLNVCHEEKDVGVTFDCQLSFDPHIQRVVSKANQMLGLIKRSFTYLDKDTFLKLYKAFVRPHLEYANVIWYPFLKRQSLQIEAVQRRATKLLNECKDMSYNDRLNYLKLHSLKGRRIRGDLIQMYKMFHGIDEVDLHDFFSFSQTNMTRNSEGKVFIKHCVTNKRKFSFSYRVAHNWNSLPTDVKFSKNINIFKNSLDSIPKFVEQFYGVD